jgi:NADP-dependent 3-hydroxy acid dehydrogenase YdfG
MQNLKNKVVLITGASSGFGEDAALLFAEEGCKVVLAARRIDRLQTLVAKIQDAGGEAIAIPVDIVNLADVDGMVKSALDIYGQIDILFNNAGIGRVDWFENHSPERDIDMLVQVNLTALMQVTRMVLPNMLKRGDGHIINMVSVAGLIAAPLITSYSASKHGALSQMRFVAKLHLWESKSVEFIPDLRPQSLVNMSVKIKPIVQCGNHSTCT